MCGGNQAPANYNQPLCYQGFWRVCIYFIYKYPLKYPHQGFLGIVKLTWFQGEGAVK